MIFLYQFWFMSFFEFIIFSITQIQYPVTYWTPVIPLWKSTYCISHFGVILLFYYGLVSSHSRLNQTTVTLGILALLLSITSFGLMLENRIIGTILESFRCLMFSIILSKIEPDICFTFNDSLPITREIRSLIPPILILIYLSSCSILNIYLLVIFYKYSSKIMIRKLTSEISENMLEYFTW